MARAYDVRAFELAVLEHREAGRVSRGDSGGAEEEGGRRREGLAVAALR
jgi:hypothetical protein